MSFLTAEWRKLTLANYIVPQDILKPYVPFQTELDPWKGEHYVSLVGFLFKNTKLLGVKIPFHHTFAEANLRFYVRYKMGNEWRRGVVFIKEIVPRRAITWVANTFYGENYKTMPMSHHWAETDKDRIVAYQWRLKYEWQKLAVKAELEPKPILENSDEEYITEHYWGYTKINDQQTTAYEVTHPRWVHYPVQAYDIDVDFEMLYGKAFGFLSKESPQSVMLAEGSAITVEGNMKI